MSVILTAVSFTASNTEAVQMNYADNPQAYLTEWDTTTIPTIAAGKSFYIGGAAYRSSGTGAIGGTVPSSDGTYYLKVVLSTMAVEWETSPAAYSWSESNGGWYNSTTAMLLPVTVVRYSSGSWRKFLWIDVRNQEDIYSHNDVKADNDIIAYHEITSSLDVNAGNDVNADVDINAGGDVNVLTGTVTGDRIVSTDKATIDGVIYSGSTTSSSQSVPGSGNYVLPKGIWLIYLETLTGSVQCEINSLWVILLSSSSSEYAVMVISDGTNARVANTGATKSFYYRRFT